MADEQTGVYICGQIERYETEAFRASPWPRDVQQRLTYHVDVSGYTGQLTKSQIDACFSVAWQLWAKGVDIKPVAVADPSQAYVAIRFGPIDGPSKTLAWSELADGSASQRQQLYDSREPFMVQLDGGRPPASMIDLLRVACHEIGHVLGLVHDDQDGSALLAPMYSREVGAPTKRDIDRLVSLGYPRAVATDSVSPAGTITLPIEMSINVLDAYLRQKGYKVVRV